MTTTVRGKPALVRDGVRGLTEKEIEDVAGGGVLDNVGKFFHTVGSDIATSMKGAAGQVRWLLDKCDWGAVAAGALRAAKSLSISSWIALS
jgi:hypothetical protein